MRRTSFRTVLIAVACGFFLLGLASTILKPTASDPAAPRSTPALDTASSTPFAANPQRTVLILGVDSLLGESPELLAVWLASFRPPGREVFLLGLPVDRPVGDGSTLREAFAWSGAPDPAFLDSLSEVTPLPIDIVAALDSQGFSALIDFLGGVPTEGNTVDGAAALSVLTLLRDDPTASLQAQLRLLQALVLQVGGIQPGSDLQPLAALVPDHAYLSLPVSEAIALVAPALPFDPLKVHLRLPEAPASDS